MRRSFDYFLYRDLEGKITDPKDPNKILGDRTDSILTEVARFPAGQCSYDTCRDRLGEEKIQDLIACGVLRRRQEALVFDCPVFLKEDVPLLGQTLEIETVPMVELLEPALPKLNKCCGKLINGSSEKENLHHILCNMIFDGYFFEYLNGMGIVAISRWHPSGLNYLSVICERCEELQLLSRDLLCSCKQVANEQCALRSFGTPWGVQRDLDGLLRAMERKEDPDGPQEEAHLLQEAFGGLDPEGLLCEVQSLIQKGHCIPAVLELLERTGYAKAGKLSVPVYLPEHRPAIMEMEAIVEGCLGEVMANMLLTLSEALSITPVEHGVNRMEVAGELYHLLFGSICRELMLRGYVAALGKNGCLKCIEVYR